MTKKVTGKDLKTLIEGVLNEKKASIDLTNLKDKLYKGLQSDYKTKEPDIQDLANLDTPDSKIDQGDVNKSFNDPQSSEAEAAKWLAKSIQRSKPESETMISYVANAAADAAEFKAGDIQSVPAEEIRSIAFKSMQNVSADPTDAKTMGQFPEGIATALNTVMKGKTTFKERMEHLAKVCSEAVKDLESNNPNPPVNSGDITNYIAKMLVLDYVTTLMREVDSGSNPYQFEAFLAMLVGGRVVGKEVTSAGKMGGADFRSSDGSAGSSKLYSKLGGITQSSKGFTDGEPVFYVICVREKTDKLVTKLKIYTLFVNKIGTVGTKDFFAYKYSNGDLEIKDVESGKKINLSTGLSDKGDPLVIDLATASNTKDIRAVVTSVISARSDNLATVLKKMEEVSRNLYIADQKSQAYGSTGKRETADEALKSIQASESAISDMINLISTTGSSANSAAGSLTQESKKITSDLLKKIISESFKK